MKVYLIYFKSFLFAMFRSLWFFLLVLSHPRKRLVAFFLFLQRIVTWKDVVVDKLFLPFLAFLFSWLRSLLFPKSELKLHVVINVNLFITDWNAIGQKTLSNWTLWAFKLRSILLFLIFIFSLLVVWSFWKIRFLIIVFDFLSTLANLAFFFLVSSQLVWLWMLRKSKLRLTLRVTSNVSVFFDL